MTDDTVAVDIDAIPELARLVEEVCATGTRRVLRRNSENVAVLIPAPRPRRRRGKVLSKEDLEAFLSSAGGWADMDTDTLVANIYADRRASNRPPIEL